MGWPGLRLCEGPDVLRASRVPVRAIRSAADPAAPSTGHDEAAASARQWVLSTVDEERDDSLFGQAEGTRGLTPPRSPGRGCVRWLIGLRFKL